MTIATTVGVTHTRVDPRAWPAGLAAAWKRPLSTSQLAVLVTWLLYVAAGIWIRYGIDYAIGDSLSRSATARAAVFSAAPRATAVGFVWMPLPSMLQIPFVVSLEPFGLAEFAGPLSTATCGAATVALLLRMGRRLDLPGGLSLLYVALYALNPIVAFHAANGMSEAVFYLFFVWALDALTDWMETQSPRAQLRVGLALAGAMAVRYEALLLAVAFAAFMGLRRRGWRAKLLTAFVVALPTFYGFFLWLAANRLIMGDALFWKHALDVSAQPPEHAAWLPARNLVAASWYSLWRSVLLAPGLFLLGPVSMRRRAEQRWLVIAVVGVGLVCPLFTAYLIAGDASWGNLRYYAPLIPVVTVLAIWFAARSSGRFARAAVATLLAMGILTGTAAASNRLMTAPESEWQVFEAALGRSTPAAPDVPRSAPGSAPSKAPIQAVSGTTVERWRTVARQIDQRLDADDSLRVAIDMGVSFPAFLMSRHPSRFLINSDDDFEVLAAAGFSGVDLAFSPDIPEGMFAAGLGERLDDVWNEEPLALGTLYVRKVPSS